MGQKVREIKLKNAEDTTVVFQSNSYLTSKGFEIFEKIGKIILPSGVSIISIARGASGSMTEKDIDLGAIAEHLVNNLSKDKLISTIKLILSETFIGSKPLSDDGLFDEVFSGDYYLLVELLKEVLEFNYKNFFVRIGILKVLGEIKKRVEAILEKTKDLELPTKFQKN